MPDLVLVYRRSLPVKVVLLQLTVLFDSVKGSYEAMQRKEERYRRLTSDLKAAGYNAVNLPLEIGSRGGNNTSNLGVLATLASIVRIPPTVWASMSLPVFETQCPSIPPGQAVINTTYPPYT